MATESEIEVESTRAIFEASIAMLQDSVDLALGLANDPRMPAQDVRRWHRLADDGLRRIDRVIEDWHRA